MIYEILVYKYIYIYIYSLKNAKIATNFITKDLHTDMTINMIGVTTIK